VIRLDAEIDSAVFEPLGPGSAPPACESLELTAESSPGLVSVGKPGPSPRQGRLRLNAGSYLMSSAGLGLDRDRTGLVELRLRAREMHRIVLAWSHQEISAYAPADSSIKKTAVDLIADGRSRTYQIDLRKILGTFQGLNATVGTVFLVPFGGRGAVEVESLRFIPRRCTYLAAERGFGTAYETLGDEMRYGLFTVAPSRLAFRLRVPPRAPFLELGFGILEAWRPATLRLAVVDGADRTVLLDEEVAAQGWSDRLLDLGAWAGGEIELELDTVGSSGTVALWSSPTVRGAAERPTRVVLILEDTLRADHLSLHGHPRQTSPALDALAERGATFERAYSTATKTRPSVPSLMTSLYPSATGVVTTYDRLAEPYVTLAEILRAAGFATAAFIQNSNAGPAAGLHQGFDRCATRPSLDATLYDHPDVVRWLEQHRERSFFLYLHLLDPHGPYDPGPPFDRWYQDSGPGTTELASDPAHDPEWIDRPTLEGRRLLYDGEIRRNDEGLGRLLARLESLGMDDALLIFLSDHGEHLGEHGLWEHHPPSYTQGVHVPLVIVAPGRVRPGLRLSDPVSLIDVVPTVVDLLGLDGSSLVQQGRSLRRRLEGGAKDRRGVVLVEEATVYRGPADLSVSAIFGPLHVLFSRLRAPEIYDVGEDPRQERPLPPSFTRRRLLPGVADYARRLSELNQGIREALGGGAPDVLPQDPEAQEQLRALGYL
jgi:arylsulfatase A-like enzyme